jgi:hypothetical protein
MAGGVSGAGSRHESADSAQRIRVNGSGPAGSLGTVGHGEVAQHVVDVLQRRDRVDDLGEMLPEGGPLLLGTAWRAPGFRGVTDPAGGARAYLAAARESALVPAPG